MPYAGPSPDLSRAILERLIDLLYARRRLAILTLPPVAALYAAVNWHDVPRPGLQVWAAAVLAATLVGIWLHRAYARRRPDPATTLRWARLATAHSLLNGCVLGSAGYFLFPPDAVHQVFLLLVLGGVSSTAIASTSSYLPAYNAFVIATLAPVLVRLVACADGLHWAMAALVLTHAGFMVGLAWIGNRTLVEAAALAFENRALVEDLSRASRELERVVADRTKELERARDALRTSEEQFRQAQKLEALGRLAGGVAHDFNNALAVITGYCELLLDAPGRAPADREMLVAIRRSADHATTFTRQLLAFSRQNVFQPVDAQLGEVVRGAEAMLRGVTGESITLVLRLDPAAAMVRVHPDHVVQAVMNLVVNARDAIRETGTIEVEVANRDLGPEDVAAYPDARPVPYVMLAVRDTGCGMDEATRARIFEPFFTTKDVGVGTGLGLANVYGIVKQSGGLITVETAPGRGSTFRIYFPRVQGEIRNVPETPVAAFPAQGTGTVLVVEDEELVRGMVQNVLSAAGYSLLVAEGPERALEISRGHPGPIRLMVTDIRMPGMTGIELARVVAEARPDTRFLFMSGYFTPEAEGGVMQALDGRFLQKPFAPRELVRMVQTVLTPA